MISRAAGDQSQNDIQYISADEAAPDAGCVDEGNCPPACDGYDCYSGSSSAMSGFMQRLECMQKSMQQQGVTYAVVASQFYQGVTHGGVEQDFDYGGKVDQFLILDSGKLGLWQGMTATMHVETRFGDDINFDAVGFAPANVAMLYPKFNEDDTAITGLSFAQALNENVALTFGKFNALDLFYMLYPQTGRGINGFMNTSMVIPIGGGSPFLALFHGGRRWPWTTRSE